MFYKYLQQILPIKRLLFSLSLGFFALAIVLYCGLSSEFIRSETVFARAANAFSFCALLSFIVLMAAEEFAIFKTKRELESLIDHAILSEVDSKEINV